MKHKTTKQRCACGDILAWIPAVGALAASAAAFGQDWIAGESFRDCPDCPEMVVVPAGSFRMGCLSNDSDCDDDEFPVHDVRIPQPFALGKFEVTFAEWDACVSAGGCDGYEPDDGGYHRGRVRDATPVINVSWDDAQAYVTWLSEATDATYRLPSEAEWEYAARAGTITKYPWGDEMSPGSANCDPDDCNDEWRNTSPVGSFPANPFGLHDMHGNVWEWVEDCWNDSYAGAPSDSSARLSGDCSQSVRRGGSWLNGPGGLRSSTRGGSASGQRDADGRGFRVARTLDP